MGSAASGKCKYEPEHGGIIWKLRRLGPARPLLEGLREVELPDNQMGAIYHKGRPVPAPHLNVSTTRLRGGAALPRRPSRLGRISHTALVRSLVGVRCLKIHEHVS